MLYLKDQIPQQLKHRSYSVNTTANMILGLVNPLVTGTVIVEDKHPEIGFFKSVQIDPMHPNAYLDVREQCIADLNLPSHQFVDAEVLQIAPGIGNNEIYASIAKVELEKSEPYVNVYGWSNRPIPNVSRVSLGIRSKRKTREVTTTELRPLSELTQEGEELMKVNHEWNKERVYISVRNEAGQEIGQIRRGLLTFNNPADFKTALGWVVFSEFQGKDLGEFDLDLESEMLLTILRIKGRNKEIFFGPWQAQIERFCRAMPKETRRSHGEAYLRLFTPLWRSATLLLDGEAHEGYPFLC